MIDNSPQTSKTHQKLVKSRLSLRLPDHKQNTVILLLLLIILFLLSISLDRLELLPGEKAVFSRESIANQESIDFLSEEKGPTINPPLWILLVLLAPVFIAIFRIVGKIEWDSPQDMDWKLLFSLFTLGILAIVLVGLVITFADQTGSIQGNPLDFREPKLLYNPVFQSDLSIRIISGLALLLGLTVLFVIMILHRKYKVESRQQNLTSAIAVEARLSVAEFASGKDPRTVIIQCYQRMCELLNDQHGLKRGSTMTAHEFITHIHQAGFQSNEAEKLTLLFEQARYGEKAFSDYETSAAINCLKVLGI